MAKYILGLEIGSSNIKLLECRKKGKEMIIEKSQTIPTPQGAVEDGKILEIEPVYDLIRKQKFKAKNLVAIIKSSEIIARDIKMDMMPKKDLEAILAIQYQDHLLVDIENYQVTYKVVKELEETSEYEILIVAAPNTIIYPLIELAKKLKIRIQAINIAADAITSIFSPDNPMTKIKEEEIMVIDIGGESTTVTIVSNGIGVLNRDIPFGLDAINPLITREFGPKDRYDIDVFKNQHAGIYEDEDETGEYQEYISSVIKPMIEYQLVSEIQRLLQFYFSRDNHKPIEKAYIVGGGSFLKNLDQHLSSLLGFPCVSGIDLDLTRIQGDEEFIKQSAYYANILGLVSEYWGS